MKKRLLSGIRTSGVTHIGNVFGAVNQWVKMQENYESYTFIADLHSLTTPFKPGEVRDKTIETARIYIALGLNPEKSAIFVQSHVPEHTQLAWILGTNTYMGELSRMTQFKEKSSSLSSSSVNLGLFAYPVLMAADILAYNPDVVPVGEDQKQHVELTRDLAQRFNSKFGSTFKIPEPIIQKISARIMGLDNPENKMSKSAASPKNYISVLDDADTVQDKIKSAVTDSGNEVFYDPGKKPAISNLLTIYSLASGQDIEKIEKEFKDKGYGKFKQALAEVLINYLSPIQEKYNSTSEKEVQKVLEEGAEKARKVASQTLQKVKKTVGLLEI